MNGDGKPATRVVFVKAFGTSEVFATDKWVTVKDGSCVIRTFATQAQAEAAREKMDEPEPACSEPGCVMGSWRRRWDSPWESHRGEHCTEDQRAADRLLAEQHRAAGLPAVGRDVLRGRGDRSR